MNDYVIRFFSSSSLFHNSYAVLRCPPKVRRSYSGCPLPPPSSVSVTKSGPGRRRGTWSRKGLATVQAAPQGCQVATQRPAEGGGGRGNFCYLFRDYDLSTQSSTLDNICFSRKIQMLLNLC